MSRKMVPWVGGSYKSRSIDLSSQSLINMYTEIVDNMDAKAKIINVGRPGTEQFIDLSSYDEDGSIRGIHKTATGRLFVSTGTAVLEVCYDDLVGGYTAKNVGNIGSGNSYVEFDDNGDYLVAVDGVNIWTLDLNNAIAVLKVPAGYYPINANHVALIKGYFVVSNSTKTFHVSQFNDPTSWDILDQFDTPSSNLIVNIINSRDDLWVFTKNRYIPYQFTGNYPELFKPIPGVSEDIGLGAEWSVCQNAGTIYWMGASDKGNRMIFASDGYSARKISDHALDHKYETSVNGVSGTIGYTWQLDGHSFVAMTTPEIDETWVLEMGSGTWSQFATRDRTINENHVWEPTWCTEFNGKIIFGSSTDNRLINLNTEKYDEWDGRPIVRSRTGPVLWDGMGQFSVNQFLVDFQSGVGLISGQGSDPQVMGYFSTDGGETFGTEQLRSVGKIGEHKGRVSWRTPCRVTTKLVVRIQMSDPVEWIILGGSADITRLGTW